ncbi:ATP-binding protein [Pseudomonas sp. GD03817]|uniref:ATP-binding protein n=1 Tax=Pseudomonas TaxID=286 RepID=UPI002363272B|nr:MULTISPECIES: ATP-binding protein [Pseudomonas]MDD2040013.1 ATP-binding protein [Pseudomonas putida]MDD2045455.1 ATP-binding protein [Pseudomonas putida]MDH1403913.1 ATP-binding protein [Pseudomonas sp. GD03730]MDH1775800.1 ATP-binding protein [Pseudomonas sp. GD03817]WNI07739.1 ATP-binding protein [Pseudomonas putida]
MRLKRYLLHINPLLSNPEAARRLLRLFAIVLSIGILSGVYNFLLFTFNNDISQRRGYMSSAIAEAHAFFTNREALLESLSLSAVRKEQQAKPLVYLPSSEEIHLQLGSSPNNLRSIWLTKRMRSYMQDKQVSLLYVGTGAQAQVRRLFNATAEVPELSAAMLEQLHVLKNRAAAPLSELWLTDHNEQRSHLYIFIRLDERAPESGWLGLEMDTREVSRALSDHSAGAFMMLNADGMHVFSNNPQESLNQRLLSPQGENFFGFIGNGLMPDHLVIRKHLKSSDWQLVYSIDLLAVLGGLWKQLLGSLLFCLFSITLIVLLMRRFEQRLIAPAVHRIEALIESEAFSRDVIETAPVALCVLRRSDGKVVLENHLAQQWLGEGLERDVLCAGWIRDAFDSVDANCSDYFETADGRHLHLSSAPTRYKGEDVLFCAFSDISTRKQVEAALEEARQSADAANEAKTLFLATMSHEIRTPLYGVLGTLELLSRTRLDGQQKDYLHAIEGSSATLLQLICDVLDVSKIEAGQLILEVSEFSPLELVHEVVQNYSAAATSKGLQLYACLDPHLPERLIGDVSRIRQILNNLLSNAVKFTDCGRVVLRVRLLNCEGERSGLLWQVSDTGKGIAEKDQAYIFEPFYQIEGNTHVVAGTGLGLPICQRLTQLMNGHMRMVSEPGLGSSFTLTLPLEVAFGTSDTTVPHSLLAEIIYIVSPIRELAESIAGWLRRWGARAQIGCPAETCATRTQVLLELHPGRVEQHLQPDWPGPRILISSNGCSEPRHEDGIWCVNLNHLNAIYQAVSQAQGLRATTGDEHTKPQEMRQLDLRVLVAEDNIINQLILKGQLEELGCTVVLASDGDEALQHWRPGRFDVVLSDVNMPRMNGYALARELRRQGCLAPIIGATANAMRGEEELCLAAGMNRCLVKPFALQALFNCLAPYQGITREAL